MRKIPGSFWKVPGRFWGGHGVGAHRERASCAPARGQVPLGSPRALHPYEPHEQRGVARALGLRQDDQGEDVDDDDEEEGDVVDDDVDEGGDEDGDKDGGEDGDGGEDAGEDGDDDGDADDGARTYHADALR